MAKIDIFEPVQELPECPPGYYYTNGSCCPIGTVYNIETGTCEEICNTGCITISGNTNVKCGSVEQYTISYANAFDGSNAKLSFYVYLSYVGGTAINGSDFFGPNKVLLEPANNYSAKIDIRFLRKTDQKTFVISATTGTYYCDQLIEQCAPLHGKISCESDHYENGGGDDGGGTPGDGPPPGGGGGIDCCTYMPKDYIAWSRDVGVPELEPPFMRMNKKEE